MRRVALIYNPASGPQFSGHAAWIHDALAVLREAGVEAEVLATEGPGAAGNLAQEALRDGCDTVIACGGDGTVNEVLQSLVGGPAALGVVPLGTANALASDLGLTSPPAKALRMLLDATPVRVSVGRIFYRDSAGATRSRYFTVAAGMGADAQFFYRLDAGLKRRFGYAFYLVHALSMWFTHTFPLFHATFITPGNPKPQMEKVSQLLAVRICDFGGLVHRLVPGATLHNNNLRIVAFKTRSRFRYLSFITAALFRRQTFSGKIELVDAVSVECRLLDGHPARIFVEADGEMLGSLPARIEIVPDSLTLLIPVASQP
jgi:YegS/Rv2252/BmrU family lipid kinase